MNNQNTNILPEEENNNKLDRVNINAFEINSERAKIMLVDDSEINKHNWINHDGFEERGRKL